MLKVLVITFLCIAVMSGSLSEMPSSINIRMNVQGASNNFTRCNDCKLILTGVQALSNMLKTRMNSEGIFSSICVTLMPLFGHNSTTTCPDLMELYLPDIRNIIINDVLFGACEILGLCPANVANLATPINPYWLGQPLKFEQDESIMFSEVMRTFQQGTEHITFIQISDIHLDRAYVKDTPTQCGHTICCRSNITGNGTAGIYGDYNCDAAEATVTILLDFIRNLRPAPAFFVYVGDNSPHVLLDTLEDKMADNLLVNTLLVDKLRSIGPIFPVLGNHEVFPTSSYSRPLDNTQRILQSLSEQWPSMFKVTSEQLSNIRKHAYYTTLVMPGLRILTTNSLYDFMYNIYAFKSNLDPAKEEQRQFIRKTLWDARRNNEKVIYMSHMKPNPLQTYPSYSDEHSQLIADFGDVIILQLFGHEHWDAFLLNRDPEDQEKITGVSLVGPSVTTYIDSNIGINPSVRQYKLDPATFQPLDYDQYYIDIPKANEGTPEVKLHYTFTKEYNVPDMTTKSFETISDRRSGEIREYLVNQCYKKMGDIKMLTFSCLVNIEMEKCSNLAFLIQTDLDLTYTDISDLKNISSMRESNLSNFGTRDKHLTLRDPSLSVQTT